MVAFLRWSPFHWTDDENKQLARSILLCACSTCNGSGKLKGRRKYVNNAGTTTTTVDNREGRVMDERRPTKKRECHSTNSTSDWAIILYSSAWWWIPMTKYILMYILITNEHQTAKKSPPLQRILFPPSVKSSCYGRKSTNLMGRAKDLCHGCFPKKCHCMD